MALFGRTPLDPQLKLLVGRGRVLASGRSAEGQVAGLVDRLVYVQDGVPRQLPWHEVDRGHWDDEQKILSWTDVDGVPGRLALSETGRVPDLFNERVDASIACVRTITLGTGRSAVISARRNLADTTAPLIWRVAPGEGATQEQVDADPIAALELERLRAEYDLG